MHGHMWNRGMIFSCALALFQAYGGYNDAHFHYDYDELLCTNSEGQQNNNSSIIFLLFFPKQKNRSFYEAHNVIKYFDDHGGFWQV